ncbi:MAG: EAL domain-containing protein [Oscillospiraceae bacterium]|nr:EAL domain-containing protein [Oscillospiraceae bacterium]
MNAEKDRRKNRNKYLKLRKKHPWISIPVFLFSLMICAAVFMLLFNLIVQFALESRLNGAVEHVSSLAAIYEESGEEALQLYDKQKIQYVVLDADGNRLHCSGVPSYGSRQGNFDRRSVLNFSSGITDVYLYEDTVVPFLRQEQNGCVCFDYGALYKAMVENLTLNVHITDESDSPDPKKLFGEEKEEDPEGIAYQAEIGDGEKAIGLPLWIASDIGESGERMLMRTELTFLVSDVITVLLLVGMVGIIFIVVALSMLFDMIAGFVNQARIRRVLFTDIATKGKNRFWFLFKGEQLLRSGYAGRNRYAVVEIGLVKYQSICLCHSIAEGERLLGEIQTKLDMMMQKREICAHNTEGAFAVLLHYDNQKTLSERVNSMINTLRQIESDHILAFHAGIAPVNATGLRSFRKDADVEAELTNAGSARAILDSSDESGIAFFDQKLVEEQKWEDTVTECEQRALEHEEFLVYYQPKYDPQTNLLRGAEALIRWQSPEYGFVSPGRFIPIFEKNGFITEIDHYMLEHVAKDQRRWLDQGFACVPVSVNVSRAHFIESDLAEQIRDVVDAARTPHELIEIELTESAFFDDKKAMIRTIRKLKEYGFAVSMDDFGSGYSSLNSLKDMPLDVLKLDAEFFRGEEAGTDRGEIVVSEAIKLAKNLQMRTVAEGVEVKEQVDFLASQGCDMIQGYYFAKPMPGAEYECRMAKAAHAAAEPTPEEAEPT